MGNDVYMWEMASVFEERLKYVGNDVDSWEISEIWLRCVVDDFNIFDTSLLC